MDTRNGFQIGTIRGIPIRIHYTFLLVLPFLAYGFGRNFRDAARLADVPVSGVSGSPWLWGLAVALALFASVLVHELAHSFYALSHGGKVRSITLLMIGGVSEMLESPRSPTQEAVMALVGPATSIAIGVASFALMRVVRGVGSFDLSFALFCLGEINLVLGAFNLLPAFPMDGGRVLRGILARWRGPVRSTQIAAAVGKVFAVLFAIWGLLSPNLLLVIVAFFVFIGAEGEQRAVLTRAVLGDLRVHELALAPASPVAPGESAYDVAERMIREKRLSFAVAEGGRLRGTVTLGAIERVPLERRRATAASEIVEPAATIGLDDRVSEALQRFASSGATTLVVLDGERLAGMLSRHDVARALQLRELAASQHPGGLTAPGMAGHRA